MDRYNPTIENKNHLHKKNVGLFISIFTFPRFTVLIIRSGLHIKASTSDSSHQSLEHSENSTILTCYRQHMFYTLQQNKLKGFSSPDPLKWVENCEPMVFTLSHNRFLSNNQTFKAMQKDRSQVLSNQSTCQCLQSCPQRRSTIASTSLSSPQKSPSIHDRLLPRKWKQASGRNLDLFLATSSASLHR